MSKRAEIDQDDVHDVAAVAQGWAELGKVLPQPRRRVGGRDREQQPSNEDPEADGNQRVAGPNQRRRQRPQFAEVPEHEHVDEYGERLHRELRHRQIGRAEAEEDHGDAVAHGAECEDGRHRRSRESRRNRSGDDDGDDEEVVQATRVRDTAEPEARIRDQRRAPDQDRRRAR